MIILLATAIVMKIAIAIAISPITIIRLIKPPVIERTSFVSSVFSFSSRSMNLLIAASQLTKCPAVSCIKSSFAFAVSPAFFSSITFLYDASVFTLMSWMVFSMLSSSLVATPVLFIASISL